MFTDAKCPLFLVMKSFCGKKDVIGGQMQIWMKIAFEWHLDLRQINELC